MAELLLEPNMAKKKATPEKKDVFLRLPPEYGELLKKIRAITARAATVETQIALERRAKTLGVTFTPNWPESL